MLALCFGIYFTCSPVPLSNPKIIGVHFLTHVPFTFPLVRTVNRSKIHGNHIYEFIYIYYT